MISRRTDQTRQDDAFDLETEAESQDQLIAANRRSIEELEVTKGPVSRYECKGTDFNVATRNGDLYVNDATVQPTSPSLVLRI